MSLVPAHRRYLSPLVVLILVLGGAAILYLSTILGHHFSQQAKEVLFPTLHTASGSQISGNSSSSSLSSKPLSSTQVSSRRITPEACRRDADCDAGQRCRKDLSGSLVCACVDFNICGQGLRCPNTGYIVNGQCLATAVVCRNRRLCCPLGYRLENKGCVLIGSSSSMSASPFSASTASISLSSQSPSVERGESIPSSSLGTSAAASS